jgi:hypothetical protein
VADIARKLWPRLPYDRRKQRLAEWRVGFDRSVCISQKKGTGEYSDDVEQSFQEFFGLLKQPPKRWGTGRVINSLRAVVWASAIADEEGISLDALVGRVAEYLIRHRKRAAAWKVRTQHEAFAEYLSDPENASDEVMRILARVEPDNRIEHALKEAADMEI